MKSPGTVARSAYLPQIDALRALAALGVVFFHLYRTVFSKSELRPLMMLSDLRSHPGFWRWLAMPSLFGYAGVPLFFVISGFCIHHSFLHAREPFSYPKFMARRFWRIYPAYLLAIALSLALPGNLIWRSHHVYKSVLMHLLFVHNLNQTTIYELSSPLWTLGIEFQFYAAYPILLLLRRHFGIHTATMISLGLCIILSAAWHLGWIGHRELPFMPVMFWVQWCLGALIAERYFDRQRPLLNLPMAVLFCVAAIVFAVPIAAYSEWNYLGWAILGAAVIEWWLRRQKAEIGVISAAADRLLVWLGTISYSIYLLHEIVFSQLLHRLPSAPETRFGMAAFIIVPAIIAIAAVSYYLVESPGIAIGRKCIAYFYPRPHLIPAPNAA